MGHIVNLSIPIFSTLVSSIEQKEECKGDETRVSMIKGHRDLDSDCKWTKVGLAKICYLQDS
jgi:hypothetical protein